MNRAHGQSEQEVREAMIKGGWVETGYPGGPEDYDEWFGSGGVIFPQTALPPASSRKERILRRVAWTIGFLLAVL